MSQTVKCRMSCECDYDPSCGTRVEFKNGWIGTFDPKEEAADVFLSKEAAYDLADCLLEYATNPDVVGIPHGRVIGKGFYGLVDSNIEDIGSRSNDEVPSQ